MRKIILFLAIAIALIACEGPMGPQGPQGLPGEVTTWEILTYQVDNDHWELIGEPNVLGSYYIYEFKEPKLTKTIYEEGEILPSIVLFDRNGKEVGRSPLAFRIDDADVDGNLFQTSFYCEYGVGYIAFIYQVSDFFTAEKPGYQKFRVSLMH